MTHWKISKTLGIILRFNRFARHGSLIVGGRSPKSGHKDWYWTTKMKNNNITAYPLYDWNFHDVWRYIYDNQLRYNKIYDYMWKKACIYKEIQYQV